MTEKDFGEVTQEPGAPRNSARGSVGFTKFWPFVLGLAVVVLLVCLSFGLYAKAAVKKGSQASFVLQVADVFNMGAAKINGDKVLYTDYIRDVQALTTYYNQADLPVEAIKPNAEQISDQAIARLVAQKLVQQVAVEFDAKVDMEKFEQAKADLLRDYESEEAADAELETNYRLTFDEYSDVVIYPILLEEVLKEKYLASNPVEPEDWEPREAKARHILFQVGEEDDEAEVMAEAQGVLDRIKAGESFEELAAEFGSDGTAQNGGDLGWFERGLMVPEFENAVFALEPGQLSDKLVKTQFGFHVVRLDDKRGGFTAYMEERFKDSEIKLLIDIHNPFTDLFAEDAEVEPTEDN